MPFCIICDEFMYSSGPAHQCPPEWEIVMEDDLRLGRNPSGRVYPPQWVLAYGREEEDAIEKWAERYDQGGDYTIVSSQQAYIVYIRKVADEDFIGPTLAQRWSVAGESVPRYSANREEIKR